MQPTSIKINKPSANGSKTTKPTKHILNLNNNSAKAPSNSHLKKYLWLLLVLLIAESAGLIWLYLSKSPSPYLKILPPSSEIVASVYFNQVSLAKLSRSLTNANIDWPPLSWLIGSSTKELLNKTGLEQPDQLLELFADQMALTILPPEINSVPAWLILATIKTPADIFAQTQNEIERALKQNYNLVGDSYRQTKIIEVKSLSKPKNSFFYVQAKDYFILTNSQDLLKSTIDKIIEK